MTAPHTLPGAKKLWGMLAGLGDDLAEAVFDPLNDALRGMVVSAAVGPEETIPRSGEDSLLLDMGRIVLRFLVGDDERTPFLNGTIAQSPYAQFLNKKITLVTQDAILANTRYIRRTASGDIVDWLASWRIDPGANYPLAAYEAPHFWVDPKGYTLSQRIWNLGKRSEDSIHVVMRDAIRRGKGAREISRTLEAFLKPSRKLIRTRMPYGTDVSFDAMRLARTEISRAHAQAASISARLNPYVTGWDFALSARHPKFDICDGFATIGMSGERLREPYDINGAYPLPVSSTHPLCLCVGKAVVTNRPSEVTARLRAQMETGEAPPLTPVAATGLLVLLLGVHLASQITTDALFR